ncbi:protein lifeguard 1 [Nematolebias whitei]|uniref:protein lifeguard 1 n=1 Tax=Nematolebias whitei TaxID=451745 RepID=UPI001896FF6E|nr:protein lifeguard 1 [Nematolebias whitei]
MDQTGGSSSGEDVPPPPPYSPHSEEQPYTGTVYQVGKGNIAVVAPPGYYSNTVHPEHPAVFGDHQGYDPSPPSYTSGSQYESEDGVFSDDAVQKGFIRKVYLTLMIQLLLTVGIICAFLYCNTLRRWVIEHHWFSFSMILSVSFSLQHQWDFTLRAGFLWALLWSFISFALLCAIIRSQYTYIFYAFLGTLLFSLYLVSDTQLILGGKHRKYQISPEEYVFATLNLYLDIVTMFLFLLQCMNLCR